MADEDRNPPPACASCQSPLAQLHRDEQGPVWLCPACAALAGLGCP